MPKEVVQHWALDHPATGKDMYSAKPDVFADGAQLLFTDQIFTAVFCLEMLSPEHAAVIGMMHDL